mmetsp:Transcript_158243/g.303653  ORF Transcript_158243/g.303653 Transcript_158243/m.303653 type:complete len:303 (-) Transcript_158243:6-914(-)
MSALNKLIDSVVKQGTAQPGKQSNVILPHWIFEGAKLAYHSQRSDQTLPVVVDTISHSKQEVRFMFVGSKQVWKSVSFSQIIAGDNPLRQREKSDAPASKDAAEKPGSEEGDEFDKFLNKMENKWAPPSAAAGKSRTSGPALNKVPKAWAKPEVVALDDTVDIDSSPERTAAPDAGAKVADPYGLEGDSELAAYSSQGPAAQDSADLQKKTRKERKTKDSSISDRHTSSGKKDRGRRKDCDGERSGSPAERTGRRGGSRSRSSPSRDAGRRRGSRRSESRGKKRKGAGRRSRSRRRRESHSS